MVDDSFDPYEIQTEQTLHTRGDDYSLECNRFSVSAKDFKISFSIYRIVKY